MRLTIGLFLALMVNFGLFAVMHNMTSAKNIERNLAENIQILDFVRLKREEKVETKKRELPKKPPPPKKHHRHHRKLRLPKHPRLFAATPG